MKKLNQYYIYKFKSDRLKDINNKIDIDLKTAFSNGEVISLGESELIRIVNRLKNKNINSEEIKQLFKDRKNIKKLENTKENRKKLSEISKNIYDILFIPELINIEFTDTRHYKKLINEGLWVNGKKYERLLTGAGMARRSTVQFVECEFGKLLKPILNNDRNPDIPLVDSKWNAYYALVSSASYPVTTPKFCVVKDYEFTKERLVDFVVEVENGNDYVEERYMDIKSNAFDGQGLISMEMSGQWSNDLELNYIPNSFCIRGSYLKGQVVAFDFHKFAKEIAHKNIIVDAWGNEVNIQEVDVILTVSQLKLWNCYDNCQFYMDACNKNGIGWGVSRPSPKKEKDYFYSSYQLLQVLDLTKEEIEEMCRPTIEWISNVSSGDVNHALLYLIGNVADREEVDDAWFQELNNYSLQATLLNHDLFKDSYFKRSIYQTLNKKIKESRMGKLLFPGNWQVCIADPYAMSEYIFGMEVKGLLQENEHYCQYWNNKGIDTVASGRSPLTWKSEMNILHLQNNEELKNWFDHIHSGVIFNIHGIDTMLMADSDFDYDLCFTTSQKEFIKGASGGKPVTYEKKLPSKNIINEDKLYLADINTMGSHIGWITNLGTTLYSLLPLFKKDSLEYKEIISRLIIIRKCQGNEIDRGKGILVKPLPKWDKWIQVTDKMTEIEKNDSNFKNKLIINRRPRFMIYLYPEYMRKYKNHQDIYQNYCESFYGYSLEDLINKQDKSNYEKEIYKKYQEFNPYIDSESIMGIICAYMENSINEIKLNLKDGDLDISCLFNSKYLPVDNQKLNLMQNAYKQFRSIKEGIYNYNDTTESIGNKIVELNNWCYENISNNSAELANLSLQVSYKEYSGIGNRDFCWKVFGKEIIENLIENGYDRAKVPLVDKFGNIHYLGKRYSLLGVKI